MNFTREPIIETIISPKEGYKLVVRNSKGSGHEEYIVDAVEVVSFGHSFFFRSLERPKSFLVPVSDFEIIETKETRVVLKNASFDRSIKIGGGKKEKAVQPEGEEQEPAVVEQRLEKKRECRRHKRKRPAEIASVEEKSAEVKPEKAEEKATEGGGSDDEVQTPSSSTVRRFIPPPTQLISEKFPKEKSPAPEKTAGDVLPKVEIETPQIEESVEDEPKKNRRRRKVVPEQKQSEAEESAPQKEETASEQPPAEPSSEEPGGEVKRMATETVETATSTSFSVLESQDNFFGKIW